MNDSAYQRFQDLAGRRRLSVDDRKFLREYLDAHPELRAHREMDERLDLCVDRLPDAPVSSNFTARVLGALDKTPRRARWWERLASPRLLIQWTPRLAMAMLFVGVGFFSFRQYDTAHHRHVARQLAEVAVVAQVPDMEWLKDFETINRLSQAQVADHDLLAALQ